MTDSHDISNLNFHKLSKIPPGFSGVLVDWSIGPREITATILDLIVKGNLNVVGKHIIMTNKKPAKDFENKFIKIIFGSKESLTFDEMGIIAYSTKFKELIKIITNGMITEGVVDKDFQKKMTKHIKDAIKEFSDKHRGLKVDLKVKSYDKYSIKNSNKPINIENIKIIPKWAIIASLIFLFIISIFIPQIAFFTLPLLIFAVIVYYFVKNIISNVQKKTGKGLDWILTDAGKEFKKHSLDLKNYMERYPLLEDRLANELVGHSVAFGIGRKWMKKLSKNYASLLFFESISSKGDTLMNFMDLESFAKEFE